MKSKVKSERKERGGSSRAAHGSARCEGWRRHGGVFTFGPVTWEQCEAKGIVALKFKDADSGKVKTLPACKKCWAECLATGVTIIEARPIAPNAPLSRPKDRSQADG